LPSRNLVSPEHYQFVRNAHEKKNANVKKTEKKSESKADKPKVKKTEKRKAGKYKVRQEKTTKVHNKASGCKKRITRDKGKVMPTTKVTSKKLKIAEDDASCLYCDAKFTESFGSNRRWIQCTDYNRWAHIFCAGIDSKTFSF